MISLDRVSDLSHGVTYVFRNEAMVVGTIPEKYMQEIVIATLETLSPFTIDQVIKKLNSTTRRTMQNACQFHQMSPV